MSEYGTMTSEGKNLRDEEKLLDDKLMDLGLLEPGMTLQEKRDLVSVLLESTRMAQEQMSQRVQDEQWEVMQISPDEDNKSINNKFSKKPELITIPDEPESECLNGQEINKTKNERELKDLEHNNSDNRYEHEKRGNRERRGGMRSDRERREDDRTMKMSTRKNKMEKEEAEDKVKEMKKKEDEEARDRQQRELQKREHRERREEEMRRRETRKNEIDREAKKAKNTAEVIDAMDEDKTNAEESREGEKILKDRFYGPSYLRDVKQPSPLRSEIYGSAQKSRPQKVGQVSLIKLAEEAMQSKETDATEERVMKGNVFRKETSSQEKKTPSRYQTDSKELVSSPLINTFSGDDDEDRNKFLRKYRKHVGEGSTASEENKDKTPKMHWKGERLFPREVKNICSPSENAPVTRDDRLLSLANKKERNEGMSKGNSEKRRRNEHSNSEHSSTGGESQEASVEGEILEEDGDLSVDDVQMQGEKKRRIEKGQLMKRWADVVTSEKSEEAKEELVTKEEVYEEDIVEMKPKKNIMPNKRWRRVRRKYKSSFGSGSEVDEWISSEEEKKTEVKPITKEEVIARFDDYLSHLKVALHKKRLKEAGQVTKHLCNYSCKQKKKYKVPPGFQEPESDSDDEYNLWKICFGDKYSLKNKPVNRDTKDDSTHLSENMAITRSKISIKGTGTRSRSSSKSPSSLEGDQLISRSPLHLSPVKELLPSLILDNEEVRSTSKSPSLKDITLFNKVTCPVAMISRSTQTQQDDDMDSNHSSSSCATGTNSTLKRITPEPKPMWELFEVDSETEKGDEISTNQSLNKVSDEMTNVTMQRPKKDRNPSPCYLLEPNEEDLEPSTSYGNATPENVRRNSLDRSLSRLPISEKVKRNESKKRILSLKERPEESFPKKVNEEIEDISEEEKELLADPLCREEKTAELPESVACPICSHFFPMTEIEVHASGCNPKEDDESSQGETSSGPRLGRGQRHRAGGVTMAEEAGASYKRFKMEEEEEELEDDDFEDLNREEDAPRPPPLASFVPISQQKDSLIDYSDQFPHHSSSVNIQTSLERMRKSLMRGRGKKRSGWRRRKKGKWKGIPKK